MHRAKFSSLLRSTNPVKPRKNSPLIDLSFPDVDGHPTRVLRRLAKRLGEYNKYLAYRQHNCHVLPASDDERQEHNVSAAPVEKRDDGDDDARYWLDCDLIIIILPPPLVKVP